MIDAKLIRSKIDKAEQRMVEAKVLFENGFYDSVINRLYYSLFYGVNGCLLVKEIFSKTHSGAKNKFHLVFIKPGIISEANGKLLIICLTKGAMQIMVILQLIRKKMLNRF